MQVLFCVACVVMMMRCVIILGGSAAILYISNKQEPKDVLEQLHVLIGEGWNELPQLLPGDAFPANNQV